jgi:hypothetical protein
MANSQTALFFELRQRNFGVADVDGPGRIGDMSDLWISRPGGVSQRRSGRKSFDRQNMCTMTLRLR